MVGQAARAGSGPLPVRRTDVGGRHLGSGDSGLASIKNAKALLFTALLYIFFKVEMFSVYNYYYNSILSPMMIWVTIFFVARAERRFSLRMPRMAAATLAIACLTGAGVAAGLTGAVRKGDFVWNGREFYSPAVRERLASFFPKPPSCIWAGWTGLRHYLGLEAVRKILVPSKLPVGGNGQGAV